MRAQTSVTLRDSSSAVRAAVALATDISTTAMNGARPAGAHVAAKRQKVTESSDPNSARFSIRTGAAEPTGESAPVGEP